MAKRRITVSLDAGLVERLLNACWHLRRNISAVCGSAIAQEVKRLEAANGKKPFDQREGDLPTQWQHKT